MTIQFGKLSNGFTVGTDSYPASGILMGAYTRAGTRDEKHDQNGIAHLGEHLAFKSPGAKRLVDEMCRAGIEVSAETDHEGVGFTAHMTNRDIATRLLRRNFNKDLNNVLRGFRHLMLEMDCTPSVFRSEVSVVGKEIGEYHDNLPAHGGENLMRLVYPDHPCGSFVLGTQEALNRYRLSDLQRWQEFSFTHAGNLFLSVVGNINHDEVMEQADKVFGGIKPGGRLRRTKPKFHEERHHERRRDLAHVHTSWGWKGAPYKADNHTAIELATYTLANGHVSGRLFDCTRNQGHNYDLSVVHHFYSDNGVVIMQTSTTAEEHPEQIGVVKRELMHIHDDLSRREFETARNQMISSMARDCDTIEMRFIDLNQQLLGQIQRAPLEQRVDEIMRVTRPQVAEVLHGLKTTSPAEFTVGPISQPPSFEEIKMPRRRRIVAPATVHG